VKKVSSPQKQMIPKKEVMVSPRYVSPKPKPASDRVLSPTINLNHVKGSPRFGSPRMALNKMSPNFINKGKARTGSVSPPATIHTKAKSTNLISPIKRELPPFKRETVPQKKGEVRTSSRSVRSMVLQRNIITNRKL
jgi:hypothetical protein